MGFGWQEPKILIIGENGKTSFIQSVNSQHGNCLCLIHLLKLVAIAAAKLRKRQDFVRNAESKQGGLMTMKFCFMENAHPVASILLSVFKHHYRDDTESASPASAPLRPLKQ